MNFVSKLFKRRKTTDQHDQHEDIYEEGFNQLFDIKEIFQSIVMSGYIPLPNAIQLSLVCKEWYRMINSAESYNMYMKSFIRSVGSHLVNLKIPNSFCDEIFWTKIHVKKVYEMMKGWSELRNCQENKVFKFKGNQYPFIGDKHVTTAQQFFPSNPVNRVLSDFPARFAKHTVFGLLMNVGSENELFNFEKIYWTQKKITYEYDDWLYLPMIQITKKGKSNFWKDIYFGSKAGWEVISENVIRDVIRDGKVSVLNKEYQYVFGNCYEGELVHKILGNIRKCSRFHLQRMPYGFIEGPFGDSDDSDSDNMEDISNDRKASNPVGNMTDLYDLTLKKMLYEYLTLNLLNIPICREYIFTLLIYLSKPVKQSHRLSFYHDSLLEGSSLEIGADENVMDWLAEYKKSAANSFDEIFHSIVRMDLNYDGAQEGEEVRSNLFVLSLKRDDSTQTCEFEFLDYHYYEYKLVGEILS